MNDKIAEDTIKNPAPAGGALTDDELDSVSAGFGINTILNGIKNLIKNSSDEDSTEEQHGFCSKCGGPVYIKYFKNKEGEDELFWYCRTCDRRTKF